MMLTKGGVNEVGQTWVTVAMATMYKSRRGDWSLSSISRGAKVRASPWLQEGEGEDSLMKANLKRKSTDYSPSWEHTVWEPRSHTKSFPEELYHHHLAGIDFHMYTHFSLISNTCPPVLLKSTQLGSSVNCIGREKLISRPTQTSLSYSPWR